MINTPILFFGRVCLFALAARALVAADTPLASVLRADGARVQAMMAGDGGALAAVLSDTLVFVHSDGRIDSKADYLKYLRAGDTAYADARTFDVTTMEPTPGVVILIGAQQMKKRLGAAWSDVNLRFMSVWRNESGAWRMVAWQSMRPAGNSVVPRK